MDLVKKYLPLLAAAFLTFVLVMMGFVPKLTGALETRYLFGVTLAGGTGISLFEPYGRYAIGLAELAAVVLLWLPGRRHLGGGLAALITAGAVLFHVTVIGVVTQFPVAGAVLPLNATTATEGDGGTLFLMAALSLIAGSYLFLKGAGKK